MLKAPGELWLGTEVPGTMVAWGLSHPTAPAGSMAHGEATSTSHRTTLVSSLAPGVVHLLLARRSEGSVGGGQAAAAVETVIKCKSSPCAGVKCPAKPMALQGEVVKPSAPRNDRSERE